MRYKVSCNIHWKKKKLDIELTTLFQQKLLNYKFSSITINWETTVHLFQVVIENMMFILQYLVSMTYGWFNVRTI
jgi:hypothetical protein